MYEFEDYYWWFQGRLRMIESVLKRGMTEEPRAGRVLDVGCGTGLMLDRLKQHDPLGVDFSRLAISFCQQRGLQKLVQADVVDLPYQDESLDLVLALDLMEHIENDQQLAREFCRVLRKGGYLMATVPAHQSLWSDHDIALHHFRRYSKAGFRELLEKSGFEPIKYSYGISFTYLPIVTFRRIQKFWQSRHPIQSARPRTHLIPLPWFLNSPLIWMLHMEAWLLKYINLPVGVSLVALCKKK